MYYAIGIGWFVCGVIAGFVASVKNRNAFGWFVAGCLFGIIALLIIIASSPLEESQSYEISNNTKTISFSCNNCGQQILVNKKDLKDIDVIVCSNCHNEIQLNTTKKSPRK